MRRLAVVIPALTAVLAVFAARAQSGAGAGQATPTAGHPLVGSWQVQVVFEGVGPVTVTNLITFGGDGTVTAASGGQLPTLPSVAGTGLMLTEGHGAWAATGERSAEASFRFLTLDQSGGISSTNTVRMAVDLDPTGYAYTGSFAMDLISPAGNPMGAGQGSLRAERIGVEPMVPTATPAGASPVAATPAV